MISLGVSSRPSNEYLEVLTSINNIPEIQKNINMAKRKHLLEYLVNRINRKVHCKEMFYTEEIWCFQHLSLELKEVDNNYKLRLSFAKFC